jgi:hypothetical protein
MTILLGIGIGVVIGWQMDKAYVRGIYKTIKRMKQRVKGR